MIICAGNNESFPFATPIGIGLVNASINLTKFLMNNKNIDKVLFVGSAGSYGKYQKFDILLSNTATNIEIGFLEKLSYSPVLQQIENPRSNVSHETLPNAIVNSSNFITSSSIQAKLFLGRGLDLENMEFFAVLKVAKEFNVSVLGLFCVTNFCDDFAHSTFLKNHAKAKLLLEKKVLSDFKEYI